MKNTSKSENAAQRLRRVINQRPVALLLHGPSANILEQRIREFADLNLSYCSLNFFQVMEKRMLDQIHKELDFVFCSSEEELPRRLGDIEELLQRSPDKVLITTWSAMEGCGDLVKRHRNQILFTEVPKVPQEELPNSMTVLLQTLVKIEATPRIFIFGADGMIANEGNAVETYFGKEKLRKENRDCCLVKDTKIFNTQFIPQLETIYHDLKVAKTEIINCNTETHLTPLPIIGYDALRNEVKKPTEDRQISPLSNHWLAEHNDLLHGFLASSFAHRPRHMNNRYENHRIVFHQNRFYGFAPYLGAVDFSKLTPTVISDYALREACFVAESMDELREKIANRQAAKRPKKQQPTATKSGVSVTINESPIVISEDTNGYVTFAFSDRFYALAHEMVGIDLSRISEDDLAEYTRQGLFYQANTLSEIQAAIAKPRPKLCSVTP